MRTTRVIPSQSSIFRNSRQYLHSNEQVFRVMQEGEQNQYTGGDGNQKRKKKKEKSPSSKKVVLKTNLKRMAINGLRFDAMSIASLQNHLLKHSEKIETARKQVTGIHAYRSSI